MDIYGLPDSLKSAWHASLADDGGDLDDQLMYETILVTLDGTPTDRAIIEHVKQLAKLAHSRLVLLHVADGWAARTYGPDAVSPEITRRHGLSAKIQAEFQSAGIPPTPSWHTATLRRKS